MNTKRLFFLSLLAVLTVSLVLGVSNASAQTTYISYEVVPGDTLGKIAYRFCTSWKDIYDINRDTIGSNPNVIRSGMVLTVPANCEQAVNLPETPPPAGGMYDRGPMNHATGVYRAPYYTVAWGDNLSSIGVRFGLPWQEIAADNGIRDTRIYAGQTLLIDDGSGQTAPPPEQGPAERVYFQPGAVSGSRGGIINQGIPKSYILGAGAGQTMTVSTVSHGEPLFISVANTRGDLLALRGVNGQLKNTVSVTLPAQGDYIVTVSPVALPESPALAFDITFTIQ